MEIMDVPGFSEDALFDDMEEIFKFDFDADIDTEMENESLYNERLETFKKSRLNPNTLKKAKTYFNLFQTWHSKWKVSSSGGLKIFKDLSDITKGELNYLLQCFFMEVKKRDGSDYPPQTLKSIMFAIGYHYKNELNKSDWRVFLDQQFIGAQDALDAAMKESARKGLLLRKRARSISFSEENELWSQGILGFDEPTKLLHTLIYLLGLNLSLRACKERRDLEYGQLSQLRLITENDDEFILYVERCSKNRMVGINRAHIEPKTTRVYKNSSNSERCPVEAYKA